ncbi:MAG TPA: ELWxxDGT repeat protein [Cyclobacteriaceae bacterium]
MISLISRGLSFRLSLFIALLVIQNFASHAQVTVVKDVNTQAASFQRDNLNWDVFCNCANKMYFVVANEFGSELWVNDGTPSGPHMVIDLNPGITNGISGLQLKCYKDLVYFSGNDGTSGYEPWVSNGTTEGTHLFKDIIPGSDGSNPLSFNEFKGNLVFLTQENNSQILWQTSGMADDLTLLHSFPNSSVVFDLVPSSSYIYLRLRDTNNNYRLDRTDGTEAGTTTLTAFPGFIDNVKVINDNVFLNNYTDTYKSQLWVINEAENTIVNLKEFDQIQSFYEFDGKLIFRGDFTTWISDGTVNGTNWISDYALGGGIEYNNFFYATGFDYSRGSIIFFKTDGTIGGTGFLVDLKGNYSSMSLSNDIPILNGEFIFSSVTNELLGEEPTITDGTPTGTHVLKDIFAGPTRSYPRGWHLFNDRLYFVADDGIHGSEIWVTDGTEAGTSLVKDIVTGTDGSTVSRAFTVNDELYFFGRSDYNHTSMFRIDDHQQAQTVQELTDFPIIISQSNQQLLLYLNNQFFQSRDPKTELTLVKDYTGQFTSASWQGAEAKELNNKVIFEMGTYSGTINLGDEFWVTDGTSAGTGVLKDINPGSLSGINRPTGAIVNNHFIFGGNDGVTSFELWTTDGTGGGTVLLKDINLSGSSDPGNEVALDDLVLFSADDGIHGNELWKTDGTPQGTVLVKDIRGNAEGSTPEQLVPLNDFILFTAYDDEHGWALWKTDGTEEGTVLVKDITPGHSAILKLNSLTVSGDLLFFSADDGVHGNELWVSDGTTEGTHLIDLVNGTAGSYPAYFLDGEGVTFFMTYEQIWKTDGTAANTSKVANINAQQMVYHKGWLYFISSTPAYGQELYKLPVRQDQTINFTAVPMKVMSANPFDLVATATSSLPVTFSTTSDKISIANATTTLLQPGSVTIKANQPGNALFNPAPEVSTTFCINPAEPVITATTDFTGAALLTSSAATGNTWFLNGTPITGASAKTVQANASGVYTVQVAIDGCLSEVSTDQPVTVTAVEDTHARIVLSPNPVSNTLRIQSIGTDENSIIEIYSINGQPLEHFALAGHAIIDHHVNGYARGLYIVKVTSAKAVSFNKFVKE